MRVLDLADLPHRPIEAHGSRGFSVGAFGISADAHLIAVTLAPGGTIGRHPAAGRQLLVVLRGEAEVSGAEGDRTPPRRPARPRSGSPARCTRRGPRAGCRG